MELILGDDQPRQSLPGIQSLHELIPDFTGIAIYRHIDQLDYAKELEVDMPLRARFVVSLSGAPNFLGSRDSGACVSRVEVDDPFLAESASRTAPVSNDPKLKKQLG